MVVSPQFPRINSKEHGMSRIPGPRPLPIIGSLHKMKNPPCLTFSKLARTFGDVFLIKLGSTYNLILNSEESLRQAFDEQGGAFSNRDPEFLALKIYGEVRGEVNTGIVGRSAFSDIWRMQHEVIRLTMGHFVLGKVWNPFERSIQTEACRLITSWLREDKMASSRVLDPITSLEGLNRRLKAAYIIGDDVSSKIENFDQRFAAYNNATVHMFMLMHDGFIDDFLPWLGFLVKSKHDRMREIISVGGKLLGDIYETHQACYQDDSKETIMDCIATFHDELEKARPERRSIPRRTVMGVISELLEAGASNSGALFLQIMLYMFHYPDVQDKVRQEIRGIIGSSRYPTFEDRQSLPYTEAVIYEVARHSSVIHGTLPHIATDDVVLGGRFNMIIPKGTAVFGNLFAIHKNPNEWLNPWEFNPGRFVNEDGQLDEEKVQKCMIFSIGMRSCVGGLITRREMFLLYGTLVHLCKFENAGTPLTVQEVGGFRVPRDGRMKVRITRTEVNISAR